MMPMPGYAAELCGAEVEEFTFLSPYDDAQYVTIGDTKVSAPCFNDILRITDGASLGTFTTNYYAGKPALSVKELGQGKVYYFGGAFGEDTAKAFLDLEGLAAPYGISELLELPEHIELAVRGDYIILLNYGEEEVKIPCAVTFCDLITGTVFHQEIVINGIDAVVLKKE